MEKHTITCPVEKKEVNPTYFCEGNTCESCPKLQKHKKTNKTNDNDLAKPSYFADLYLTDLYLNGKLENLLKGRKPSFSSSQAKPKIPTTLIDLDLEQEIKDKIYQAMSLFSGFIIYTWNNRQLQKNKKTVQERKKTIEHLKKAIEFEFLSTEERVNIRQIINRLSEYDKFEIDYSPLVELEYALDHIVDMDKADEYHKQCKGDDWLFVKPIDRAFRETVKWLNIPLKKRKQGNQPIKYFFKALQIVVYRILHDKDKAGIASEKAKSYTAKIISSFFKENLTPVGFEEAEKIIPHDPFWKTVREHKPKSWRGDFALPSDFDLSPTDVENAIRDL